MNDFTYKHPISQRECVECDVWKGVNPFLVSEVINLLAPDCSRVVKLVEFPGASTKTSAYLWNEDI